MIPTATLIERAETIGGFQRELGRGQRTLRKALKARTVADLAVANAFFNLGLLMGGMGAPRIVRRYRGEEPVAYLHPALKPILGREGVLIFQVHILPAVREIAA